jgi:hypothetical protein
MRIKLVAFHSQFLCEVRDSSELKVPAEMPANEFESVKKSSGQLREVKLDLIEETPDSIDEFES